MENSSPLAQPSNSQPIFAALRDVLADLYPEETDARVVVADAGLDAKQILFSARAQTNWHNILAEATRQERIDPLLKIVLANYTGNPALRAAYGQYRLWIDQGGYLEASALLPADAGVTIAGDVNLNQGDLVGRNKLVAGDDVGGDKIEGDKIDAPTSQGLVNRPAAPVTQHFGPIINIGALQIPIYLVIIISVCIIGIFSVVVYPLVEQWLPSSRAFAAQANGETLIVIATFHNTVATNSEAHIKIRRAIAAAASDNEQMLRVEVEPTVLNADQRTEAEVLGNRYNASMVIWGENTGVEVIVNFLNLKEPNYVAADVSVNTTEQRIRLAHPDVYNRFITRDLPQTMSFFAFFTIGQSYFLNAQYTLAIQRIEAAVALVPADTKPAGLADAYFRLGWLYQVSTSVDLNQAIAYYTKAIALDSNVIYYTNRGVAHADNGNNDLAIIDYTKAISLAPNEAAPYYNRGNAYSDQKEYDLAITDYSKVIELKPDATDAYMNRGLAYNFQKQLGKAIADYTKVIELDPKLDEAYVIRGNSYFAQHKYEKAFTDYSQAIILNPANAGAYHGRGLTYSFQGKSEEAIIDYSKAIALDSEFKDAYVNRGNEHYIQGKYLHYTQNEYREAIEDYDKAIAIEPNDAKVFLTRGLAYSELGNLEEAIANYDQAILLNPADPYAYHNRGNARADQGQIEEALADYDQAIHLKPDFTDAFWGRGLIYLKLDKLKETLTDFRRYLELRPNAENRVQIKAWIAEAEAELTKLK